MQNCDPCFTRNHTVSFYSFHLKTDAISVDKVDIMPVFPQTMLYYSKVDKPFETKFHLRMEVTNRASTDISFSLRPNINIRVSTDNIIGQCYDNDNLGLMKYVRLNCGNTIRPTPIKSLSHC